MISVLAAEFPYLGHATVSGPKMRINYLLSLIVTAHMTWIAYNNSETKQQPVGYSTSPKPQV